MEFSGSLGLLHIAYVSAKQIVKVFYDKMNARDKVRGYIEEENERYM